MSDSSKSRSPTPEELAVITAIVGGSGHPTGRTLVEGCLAGAAASNQTNWIVDIKTRSDAPATDLPNNPFPAGLSCRATRPTKASSSYGSRGDGCPGWNTRGSLMPRPPDGRDRTKSKSLEMKLLDL